MEICDIYLYVCIVFLWYIHARVYEWPLTTQRTAYFTWAGVALTNSVNSSIAHTPLKKRKQIEEKAGREGEARQNESEQARLEVRII